MIVLTRRRISTHRLVQSLRIFSQIFFFGFFFYLLLGTHFTGKDYIGPVSDDPAIYCTSLGESRSGGDSTFMELLKENQ